MPIFDDKVYACLSNVSTALNLEDFLQHINIILYTYTRTHTLQAANSPFVNNWNFFEESESYWKPASDSIALYEQLSMKKYREILRKQIE